MPSTGATRRRRGLAAAVFVPSRFLDAGGGAWVGSGGVTPPGYAEEACGSIPVGIGASGGCGDGKRRRRMRDGNFDENWLWPLKNERAGKVWELNSVNSSKENILRS